MQRFWKWIWTLTALVSASYGVVASAWDDSGGWAHRFRERRREFQLGICVGQELAQEGISLPVPQPGEPPSLDDATRAALQSAIQSCRGQLEGTPGSPQPSPTPTQPVPPNPPAGTQPPVVNPPIGSKPPVTAPTSTGAPTAITGNARTGR